MKGFTLLETLVYIALFTILIGGAVVGAYNLFEAAERGGTRVMLQEETDFLIAKVNWALSGAQAVTAPGVGTTGSALTVAKWDTSIGNPVVVAQNGTNLTLSKGGGSPAVLNNTNVFVTAFTVTHTEGSGDGITPESVEASVTLSARTPTGSLVMRQATTTVYLRK
ncbi:MAG: hypothetical protein ABA06_00710 [Parcubacteria bacterium C7867-001]|nr:MAG: hypothetical protein ABA06_00710 [Parcubacteria bacterium C7867-001]